MRNGHGSFLILVCLSMKQKKSYQSTLKWGLVLGACLSVFELVKMFARKVEYGSTQLLDIALIIGFILILYAGIKEFKDHYTERLTFAKAFFGCCLISLIGSIVFFAYAMVHYSVVEPDGLSTKYEIALDNFKKVIDRDTISGDEMLSYMDTVSNIMKTAETAYPWPDTVDDVTLIEAHVGLEKITEFHKNKILERRALDTADNYVMSNFQAYSRRILIETLQSYIAQNEQKVSTAVVQQIVQTANVQLERVDPAMIRFEQNKSHVPHYDKPGRYAALAAMMDLLYGMFFGLFIAMYHYTSKRTAAEAAGEIPADGEPIPEEEVAAEPSESIDEEIKNE